MSPGFYILVANVVFLCLLLSIDWRDKELLPTPTSIYVIVPLLLMGIATFDAVLYIRVSYGFIDFYQAVRFFMALLFGFFYPELMIQDGQTICREQDRHWILTLGGPFIAVVQPGNVLITEDLRGVVRTYPPGEYIISRFETIKDVLNLQDQYSEPESMTEMSKDGIPVTIENVRYRYRFITGNAARSFDEPYPFRRSAVIDMVYARSITPTGRTPWEFLVSFPIIGEIMFYINRHTVDQLTAQRARDRDPRREINEAIRSERIRVSLAGSGAELIWVDIGHFGMPERVSDQRVQTWRSRWEGEAEVVREYGAVQRESLKSLGRAEAQAEVLKSIVFNLSLIDQSQLQGRTLRQHILIQVPLILEELQERNRYGRSGSL
ncbi:MAG: hypothetical protein U9R58_05370 [Chloroflexota bacterium]|nr:hypothetical protein [Chloroflexota bacterium]